MRVVSALLCAALAASPVAAQRTEPTPKALEGVGVVDRRNAPIPFDLEFVQEDGRTVRLGEYFAPGRPVILTLGYYGCPMLCTLVLNGMVKALQTIDGLPGREFEIVTVSINPAESPTLAKLKQQNYLTEYGRAGAAAGWHFLTGREENIRALTAAVGFQYRYDSDRMQYAHPAGLFICTPDGRLARWIPGVEFDPKTVRLSLVESAGGKIGSSFDQLLLYCFHYDETKGRYALTAMTIMRIGGALTVVLLVGWLGGQWIRDRRRTQAGADGRTHA